MRSAICGRNIPVGHRDSYRRCLIAEDGTPNGRRRATAMKRSRHGSAGPHRCLPPRGSDAISRAASTWAGMLKVAIVGCGKIADAHASQIQRLKGCEIVGVYDREPLMAKQFYERLSVKRYFDDLTGLLSDARPDVVHVTTPPESHFAIARLCLERGCHVYVEKPFTVDEAEAQALVALASERRLKLTVGHDLQFSHVARRMRALVQSGYLGGRPVGKETNKCYGLRRGGHGPTTIADRRRSIRNLRRRLLIDVISHGLSR